MIMQIIKDQFAPNFGMAYETIQRLSVSNLKLFGLMTTELWRKEVEGKNFLLCCMGKYMEIF